MKHLLTCLIFATLCAPPVFAQGAAGVEGRGDSSGRAGAKEQLQFTTSITSQSSCGPGDLGVDLKLSIKNIGSGTVILSKTLMMGGLMVSRDLAAAAAEKYERRLRYTDFDTADDPFRPPTDLSDFVLLGAGEVFESEERVSIPMTTVTPAEAGPRRFSLLSEGTHFLQLVVGTWPYVIDPKPVRAQWKHKGSLWTRTLRSAPMPFTVDKNQPIINCSDRSKQR